MPGSNPGGHTRSETNLQRKSTGSDIPMAELTFDKIKETCVLPSPSTSLERRVTLGSYGFCLNTFALKNETPMVVSSALILYFLFLNLVAAYSRLALQIVVRRGVIYGYGHLRSHKLGVSRIRTHKTICISIIRTGILKIAFKSSNSFLPL